MHDLSCRLPVVSTTTGRGGAFQQTNRIAQRRRVVATPGFPGHSTRSLVDGTGAVAFSSLALGSGSEERLPLLALLCRDPGL